MWVGNFTLRKQNGGTALQFSVKRVVESGGGGGLCTLEYYLNSTTVYIVNHELGGVLGTATTRNLNIETRGCQMSQQSSCMNSCYCVIMKVTMLQRKCLSYPPY